MLSSLPCFADLLSLHLVTFLMFFYSCKYCNENLASDSIDAKCLWSHHTQLNMNATTAYVAMCTRSNAFTLSLRDCCGGCARQ